MLYYRDWLNAETDDPVDYVLIYIRPPIIFENHPP